MRTLNKMIALDYQAQARHAARVAMDQTEDELTRIAYQRMAKDKAAVARSALFALVSIPSWS